ncbi:LAMI_0G15566g1_1 [Lachancea mirantina]|uniref:Guanine nucleotide-binding protein alpha-2 subunit n=1 Tax=Lachancea mirantina TaxID=1230905 RepID=A0A1G4KCH0_9SACH|nr:LAMI_0G15566g1_1 [Lachancea mirantina]
MGVCTSKSDESSAALEGSRVPVKRGQRNTQGNDSGTTGTNGSDNGGTDSSNGLDEKRKGGGKGQVSNAGGATNKGPQSLVSGASGSSIGPSSGSLNKVGSSVDSNKTLKVLLLGSGESGKSTILQQLKILHQNGFTKEELLELKPFIFDNLLETGRDLVNARRQLGVTLEPHSGLTEEELEMVTSFSTPGAQLQKFPTDVARVLAKIWGLKSTQELITGEHRSEFYLMDSARYFMESLERISEPNYEPSVRDVLLCRKKTSGIFDTLVEMDANLKLHIYDVGGQRSERKKWIHCFDNVTLIIFCVSLSEYDQTLLEDKSQNRLEESLILFDSVVNSRWFARASIVLFLNKIDVFAEKVQHVPLEKYFPDFTGGKDINKAAKYILWRFVQLNRAHLNIYPHVTQATDTSNIKLVFAAIKETILENSLKDSGVL